MVIRILIKMYSTRNLYALTVVGILLGLNYSVTY